MSIRTGVIVAVTFHEVDRAPNAQASAQSNYQGLQDFNRGIEKCHIVYLQKSEIWKWNPAFAWLPVESMIHANQRAYYDAINTSNTGSSTVFIEFMLSIIKASLIDAIKVSDEMSGGAVDKATLRRLQIEKFLKTHEFIMNADVLDLCNVSAATANRILVDLAAEGKLTKCRINGHLAYQPEPTRNP